MSYKDQIVASSRLKECPFCGGVATIFEFGHGAIQCMDCPAKMEFGTGPRGEDKTIDDLIEAWNTRNRESAAATILNVKELSRVKR